MLAVLLPVGCATKRSSVSPTRPPDATISFTPHDARVGEYVEVRGSHWPDQTVKVYIVPMKDPRDLRATRDPRDSIELSRLWRNGDLLLVGRATTNSGEFTFQFQIPAELTSENGQRTGSVTPGGYGIGVAGSQQLDTSGYLLISE